MTIARGTAYLVGAGPGDPGLMTARALELIAAAETVLYDRLIPAGALTNARDDAELLYVGKEPGRPALEQDEIQRLMIDRARAGKSVVRLKGGDPFLFGRGGEEAKALREAGVPFEVVPGVTAGIAAPAYAGIPVTHRDDASAVAFVTGHEDPAKDETAIDWEALARFPGTLVFYMGVRNAERIARRLIDAGRNPEEPAAAIERGTTPAQRTVTATLAELPAAIEKAGVGAPAIILTGGVASHRDEIAWVERRPLHGRTVVVTRARTQASRLARRLELLGAEVVELPSIRVEPRLGSAEVDRAVEAIEAYELICMTSPNAAELFLEALQSAGRDARALAGAAIAAIGPGTARALAAHGIQPDIVPERSVAEALLESLGELDLAGKRVLIPRAAEARDVLPDGLRDRGATVDVVPLYETVAERPDPARLDRAAGADYITFTSSSAVTNFLKALCGKLPPGPRLVSIGPITTATARDAGIAIDVEASRHDIDGLVEALVADAAT